MRYKIYCLTVVLWLTFLPAKGQEGDTIPARLESMTAKMMDQNPYIQRQKFSIDQAGADLTYARSRFDYNLSASGRYYRDQQHLSQLDGRYETVSGLIQTNNYSYSMGLQRTFRSGLHARVYADYARYANNYPFGDFGEGRMPFIGNHFTSLGVSLIQPILRGRGKKYVTANEQVAQKMILKNQMDLTFITAEELMNMAMAYWEYVGSYQRLEIYQENESRIRRVLEITKELVLADRKAKNDLTQVQADLTSKERQTLAARQALYQARQNLGRSIGLDKIESDKIGLPQDEYPLPEMAGYTPEIEIEDLLKIAKYNRADLKTLVVQKDALEVNYELSKNALKPELNLETFMTYSGTDVGNGLKRVISPLGQIQGRNVQAGIGINFHFPINNRAAEANYLRQKVGLADQELLIRNQIRNIELTISISLNNLHNSVLKLEKAYQTLTYYEEVFEDEQVKFQNGLTTLINLILFQERLTFAQLDFLQAQQEFANGILRIRRETGTLFPIDKNGSSNIDTKVFFQLPD